MGQVAAASEAGGMRRQRQEVVVYIHISKDLEKPRYSMRSMASKRRFLP